MDTISQNITFRPKSSSVKYVHQLWCHLVSYCYFFGLIYFLSLVNWYKAVSKGAGYASRYYIFFYTIIHGWNQIERSEKNHLNWCRSITQMHSHTFTVMIVWTDWQQDSWYGDSLERGNRIGTTVKFVWNILTSFSVQKPLKGES